MTDPAIKPCPFCGRAPHYSNMQEDYHSFSCSCEAGIYAAASTIKQGMTKAEALLRWNTRVDLVTVDGMNVRDLKELCNLVTAWRDAKCSFPGPRQCDGENHLENCAQEIALQEVLAIHNKLVPR